MMSKLKMKDEAEARLLTQSPAQDSVRCLLQKWATSGGTAEDAVAPTPEPATLLDKVTCERNPNSFRKIVVWLEMHFIQHKNVVAICIYISTIWK